MEESRDSRKEEQGIPLVEGYKGGSGNRRMEVGLQ